MTPPANVTSRQQTSQPWFGVHSLLAAGGGRSDLHKGAKGVEIPRVYDGV